MNRILRPPFQCMQIDSGSNLHADWFGTKNKINNLLHSYYKDALFFVPEIGDTTNANIIFEWCHQIWQVPNDNLFALIAIKFDDFPITICDYENESYFRMDMDSFHRYNRYYINYGYG
jgi:hypothetical protein